MLESPTVKHQEHYSFDDWWRVPDYQCILRGKNCRDSTAKFLRVVEYLEIRLAGEVLDFVYPGFQLSVHED